MPAAGPNLAFLLIVSGLLLIGCEFIWVGKMWFGLAGAVCALAGIAAFLRLPHSNLGIELVLAATFCFAVEAGFKTFWIAGVLGSVLWAAGFWEMRVHALLDCAVSAIFGGLITWLLSTAKRARRNKRSL